ncbi:MAG: hypothetical protein NC908_05670 [Candidatus Omnitrophica bacterium]|nr:hypothetical protein [Candidatus Omnitrophota bacterium]
MKKENSNRYASNKRIILMYISEISGHHSATLAIEEDLRRLEHNLEILNINGFHYTNPISEKIVNRIYMTMIKRLPGIWDYLYDNPRIARKIDKLKAVLHRFNSSKLKRLFDNFQPDVVACTQAFPCGMVADFKKIYNYKVPLVAVLTDYAPHTYWIYETIDYYITPSQETNQRFIKKGVPKEKMIDLGIPFSPRFNEVLPKDVIAQKLGLNLQLPTILIMGGGHGLGPIKRIIESLEESKMQFQEIVVVGANKNLYSNLKMNLTNYRKKILLFGYVNNINEFMDVSEMIITKLGGITTAEALAKRLPMIIVNPIPGQEVNNTEYLTRYGAAIKVDTPFKIREVVEDLFLNPAKLAQMREACGAISKPNASLDIAKLLLDLS